MTKGCQSTRETGGRFLVSRFIGAASEASIQPSAFSALPKNRNPRGDSNLRGCCGRDRPFTVHKRVKQGTVPYFTLCDFELFNCSCVSRGNKIPCPDRAIGTGRLFLCFCRGHTKFLLRHIQMRSGFFVLATRSGGRRCCSIVDRSDAKPGRKRRPHLCMD